MKKLNKFSCCFLTMMFCCSATSELEIQVMRSVQAKVTPQTDFPIVPAEENQSQHQHFPVYSK